MAGLLAVLGVGAVSAQAASPVVQETLPVQSVFVGPLVDPCNGDVIAWTGYVHVIGAMTTDAAGGAVFQGHVGFEDVKGIGATGTQYTVTLASHDDVIFAPSSPSLPGPNIETHTIRINIISNDGTPNAYEDAVGHFTVTPDGQVVVYFEKVDTGCSA